MISEIATFIENILTFIGFALIIVGMSVAFYTYYNTIQNENNHNSIQKSDKFKITKLYGDEND